MQAECVLWGWHACSCETQCPDDVYRMTGADRWHALVVQILSEHPVTQWDDGTFGCHGCSRRYAAVTDAFDPVEHSALSHPGWSRKESCAHIADRLAAMFKIGDYDSAPDA